MLDKLKPLFGTFASAVLNASDSDGYPASVRSPITLDESRQMVNVQVPEELELQPGPASLLLHSHNEQLWDMRIVTVRGLLEQSDHQWFFRPLTITSSGNPSGLELIKLLLACRKNAGTYLKKRGMTRPLIPWAQLRGLK